MVASSAKLLRRLGPDNTVYGNLSNSLPSHVPRLLRDFSYEPYHSERVINATNVVKTRHRITERK